MEEQDIREAKRARNFIWAAAGDYECEPLFLAFTPDGKADMYLNMIIGLSYKWYDGQMLDDFFNMLGGKNKELYEGLLWIGLENALYHKEKSKRSALRELRKDYALANVKRYQSRVDHSLIDQIRNGHCREILKKPSGLQGEAAQLLREFSFDGDMTTEQIIARTRELFIAHFSYKPALVKKEEGIYFLQKVVGAFHSVGKVGATYVRTKQYDDPKMEHSEAVGKTDKAKHYLIQFSFNKNPENAKQYVTACFGKSLLGAYQQEKMEKQLCTDNHKNSHLLFTKGEMLKLSETDSSTSKREMREIVNFRKDCRKQYQKNKDYYERNMSLYRNSIHRLAERLRISLETESETFPEMATHGKICANKVWQAVYLDNPRVFAKHEEVETSGFSVDIMIDASSSRKNSQELIAAQAYVLEKSLGMCHIPVQIYSYCSIRGYTVMRLFKTYGEQHRSRQVFKYVAAGNNRDGLAFRGAGYLMQKSKSTKRLLIVLTDASPEDDQNLGEGAFYKSREYTDEMAVEDTAKEVQALKRKDIEVIGIFMGSERSTETARKIFGRDFVKIQDINSFADTVGRVLQEKIRTI